MRKKILALMLAMSMVVSSSPLMNVNATEKDETKQVQIEENQADANDLGIGAEAKAFGSDGVAYDGVTYLSSRNVMALPADSQKAYQEFCDDIANVKKSGAKVENVVISVDADGTLNYSFKMPMDEIFANELEFAGIDPDSVETIGLEELEEKLAEEVSSEVETKENSIKDDAEAETEVAVQEAFIEENAAANAIEENAAANYEEEPQPIDVDRVNAVYAENVNLAAANAIEKEYIGDEFTKIESILPATDYFKKQLNSNGIAAFNAGVSSIVNGGSNYISTYMSYPDSYSLFDAVSALLLTYPAKFDWLGRGRTSSYYYRYSGGQYFISVTLSKSYNYNSSYESQAQKKVKALKEKAYEYAQQRYPKNQAYGMVEYFDSWICENNYYNYDSLEMNDSNPVYFFCHSSYGALLKGYGVCESFALAQSRLLDAVGIPNVYVVGDAGGRHAWNYVQMPDKQWYMLDTTWNNPSKSDADASAGSNGQYLLVRDDGVHIPDGAIYTTSKKFKFPNISSSNYVPAEVDTNILAMDSLILAAGKTKKVVVFDKYYNKFTKKYTTSDKNVATIDKKGVVKAVGAGEATITATVGVTTQSMKVRVFKVKSLKFADNNKTEYKYNYGDTDGIFNQSDIVKFEIDVNQGDSAALTAAQIVEQGVNPPVAKSSNNSVATADATIEGNKIVLSVSPLKVGKSTITVSFAGKKATLKYAAKQAIADNWFDSVPATAQYAAKAVKPKIKLTAAAPSGVTYDVIYANNKKVGQATITIKGTGRYTNEVVRTFNIVPADVSAASVKLSKTSSTYNGKSKNAGAIVKLGKVELKQKKDAAITDYITLYNNSADKPINVGTYTVSVSGANNYTGSMANAGTYEVKPLAISKLSISCPETVKYTGSVITPVKAVKVGDIKLPESDYAVTYYAASDKELTNPISPVEKGKYVAVVTPKSANLVTTATKSYIKKSFKIK